MHSMVWAARLFLAFWLTASASVLAAPGVWASSVAGCARGPSYTKGPAMQSREEARAARERRAQLEDDSGAERPEKRRRAVRDLAQIGDAQAWELVIDALADHEPEVADEAQLALGDLVDGGLLRQLCGTRGLRSRDEWVRLRVAEALGRMGIEVDAKYLLRALERRAPQLTRTLLWSVERLARTGHLGGELRDVLHELQDWSQRRGDGGVRASALSAWLAVAIALPLGETRRGHSVLGEVLEGIEGALKDREPKLRSAGLQAWESLRVRVCPHGDDAGPELKRLVTCDPLIAALADPEVLVRASAAQLIGLRPGKRRLLALTERLAVEQRSALQWRAVAILRASTGRLHRADPRPWRDYLRGLDDGWEPADLDASTGMVRGGGRDGGQGQNRGLGEKTVALAGLPLLSDRVCVLVDFSGSLWHERPDGRTRKELVDEHMRDLLVSLPADCRFNIIPYTGEPHPWRDSLVVAARPTVRKAIDDFEDCRKRGRGNVFDAVLLALEDPDVDTVLVLTDGAPTGGQRWNLDLMIDLLVEECRYRRVAIDSIIVDARKGLQDRWRRLAELTGGRSIAIELE